MRGEQATGTDRLHGMSKGQTRCHVLADALKREEASMSLVGMEYLRRKAECPQCAHATDAKHGLLAEPVLHVAAVEAVGDEPVLGCVALNIGVEQVQRNTPDVDPPDGNLYVRARNADRDRDARIGECHRPRVELREVLPLPALCVEPLAEVALSVEQTDGDQRDAEVRCSLQVIAGKYPEPTRVLRQCLGEAELGREVRNETQRRLRPVGEPARPVDGRLEHIGACCHLCHHRPIVCQFGPSLRADTLQELNRVASGCRPHLGVQPREEVLGGCVPRPVQVRGEPGEAGEGDRDARGDEEAVSCLHGNPNGIAAQRSACAYTVRVDTAMASHE